MKEDRENSTDGSIVGLWGVRYQVKDVSRSVAFYTGPLGLKLDQQSLPAFAQVSIGNLKLLLSGPGASGSRPMPDGRSQEPGGWNRVVLHVVDLLAMIQALEQAGVHFRNRMEVGPGGRQIQVEDPDGNPIELFEPARQLVPSDAVSEQEQEPHEMGRVEHNSTRPESLWTPGVVGQYGGQNE